MCILAVNVGGGRFGWLLGAFWGFRLEPLKSRNAATKWHPVKSAILTDYAIL